MESLSLTFYHHISNLQHFSYIVYIIIYSFTIQSPCWISHI